MPGLKEIRKRIGSVKSTKQITKAMGLIIINNPEGSEIAQVMEITVPGKYALFVS